MTDARLAQTVRLVRRYARGPDRNDGELLTRLVDNRDPAAAEALIRRHGPMVLSVCRRLLPHSQDADDAFQATFLVLLRKAATVRPRNLVGPWLYGVARITALRARSVAAKRRARQEPLMDRPDLTPRPDHDLAAVVDLELARLPEKYRLPIVLCDLEGRSHREAAEQLGWPQGTVSGRLFRGRQMLAARLTARGVVASVAAVAAVLAEGIADARVPAALGEITAAAAATGLIRGPVAALTEGVLKTMMLTKLKVMASLTVLAVGGAVLLGLRSVAADPQDKKTDPPAAARQVVEIVTAPTDADKKKNTADLEKLQGLWIFVDGSDNGQKPPAEELNNTALVFRGDRVSFFIQDGAKLGRRAGLSNQSSYGRFTLDASATPKRITLAMKTPIERRIHGILSIYELDGDTLRLCSIDPNLAKDVTEILPRDFTSNRGSGKSVAVWKRSKETEQTKKQERLAKLREKAWRAVEDLMEDDDDDLIFGSPMDHQKWEQEKLDEIGRVLQARRPAAEKPAAGRSPN